MLRAMTVVTHGGSQEECRDEADAVANQAFAGADFECKGVEQVPYSVVQAANPLAGQEGEPDFVTVVDVWQGGYLYALRELN